MWTLIFDATTVLSLREHLRTGLLLDCQPRAAQCQRCKDGEDGARVRPRSFGSHKQVVYATNEQGTWDETDKTTFHQSITALRPTAVAHNAIAFQIFMARYLAVLNRSLPANDQPKEYKKNPAFKRDLAQLLQVIL
eukprot:COSAG01_NODE_1015_length_12114_cov_214.545651_13_plen_136_part_00